MANCMIFHTQIASIMEVLANAAVADICKLVDDDYAVFRLEITQSQKENRGLRRKLQQLELKMARERAERTARERVLASRHSSVKILDRYRGMARDGGHLTRGHRSFVKQAAHNSADAEAAGPGVKMERSEGEEDPPNSRDIQTGVSHVATEDLTATAPRTQCRITEVSGTPNAVLKSETDTETLTETQRLLHTRSDHRSDPEGLGRLGCPPVPSSDYLLYDNLSSRAVQVNSHRDSGDVLEAGSDLSCSYTTEMDSGNISLGLETQTDLSRGDWNLYSSSAYSEECLDKKGEVIVLDEVTVKVEGDVPLTWNVDETPSGEGHSQGRDFLDYRESLETNPNVTTHSPLHTLRDRDPVSTLMGPSNSHGRRVLFDELLNSNNRSRAQAQGEGATSSSSREKRFLCMFCNKGFSCIQKVEIHQRVHTGEKPFSCTQCHMRFTQAGDLKRHQRVHTGEKPFSCTQCQMRFSHSSSLKRHQRVHTRENPKGTPSVRRVSPTRTS
uniref:zinc finger protein 7-like isoform X4 n=1 Tax=Oncorhynchus gorbuscha TaxID=8017 RepID=UPI001EAEB425|nr:zinc finger protein 7-like isoform X4 [Oncorhynchus gorbuscha]